MSFAQNSPKVVLDSSEILFSVLTSINACGYDQELSVSDPLRAEIRGQVAKNVEASEDATQAANLMCQYYKEHQTQDASKDLASYVSLALYLTGPPFLPKVKDTDLPPDARAIAGFVPLMQAFYDKAGLAAVWQQHRDGYAALTQRYHEPLSKMFFETEVYLKIPSSVYLGQQFTIYLDPMGAPGQTNARNYGADYFVVISPAGSSLKMQEIRHTYLHYLLDPLAAKYAGSVKRLEPILETVKTAPMEESFKNDISLLVTECFVRAIEARTMGAKIAESERQNVVENSVEEGYVLTQYFYDAMVQFEKDPAGIRNAYAEILDKIDVNKEKKRLAQIQFAQKASPELLHLSNSTNNQLLVMAEQRLNAGDSEGAQKLAQQALDENQGDQGRALFILAQIATMNRDMQGARTYFEHALQVAQEPKVVAWSHIYLGRIFDLQENREAALTHYRAALVAGTSLPAAKAAAEKGLQQPYEPPASARQPQQ
ncbi:MAG TPA: tetratricopeptide repeat protein [Terriglobales bacterium]|nr:tetratricopeptide repeat protein [Terriglobales bacterium]